MPLPAFLDHFSDLPDPRVERGKHHSLLSLLTIAFCAVLCGAEGWEDMTTFGQARQDWLQTHLGLDLPFGIPSPDTFRRVFSRLDPEAFGTCFRAWVQTLRRKSKGEVIALDGKVVRHSFDTAFGQTALHLVSAWASENRLVLGAVSTEDKSNEITAFPRLLRLLDITGCIVTIDAMGCQKTIASQIIGQKGDYVLALKGNHTHLAEDVERFFERAEAHKFADLSVRACETGEKDHGRIETRRCVVITLAENDLFFGDVQAEWAGLRSLVRIESVRQIGEKSTTERRYFLSSLTGSAKRVLRAVRSHWGIENALHHVLDVSLNEDACRIRRDHAAENMAGLRHVALNLLRQDTTHKRGIKARQKQAGWDETYLLKVLTNN